MKKKITIILIILLVLTLAWYSYYQYDKENLKIDYYNFQQLWKAKKVVENLDWEKKYYYINSLSALNQKFDTDIHPTDKRYCYDVYYSYFKEKKDYTFTFWFKLHSKLWKLLNGWEYYNYPYKMKKPEPSEECKRQQKLSEWRWYTWLPACVWWIYYWRYMEIVNNPCIKE